MDCVIKLGCARPRERRTSKITSATAIVNNEIAQTNSAACAPVEASVAGARPGCGPGGPGGRTGETGAGALAAGATGAGAETGGGGAAGDAGAAAPFVI